MLGERVDARCDVFALGVVFYEIMAGETPYREPTEEGAGTLLAQMRKEQHVPLRRRTRGVPRSLRRLVRSCLRARPARRPATALELRRTLERRLRSPSPAECRLEIATWLWDRGVFERRAEETVVQVRPPVPRPRRALRAAVVVLVCGLVASSVMIVRARGVSLRDLVPPALLELREQVGLGRETVPAPWELEESQPEPTPES
jgi:hypothetical protein